MNGIGKISKGEHFNCDLDPNGDGDTSDEQNPIHAYTASGLYTVTLFVTDSRGATGQAETTAQIDEPMFNNATSLHDQPTPDLFIRTGGEQRISNFLIWQCAYAELYFCDALWPDFDNAELDRALDWYASRERRFGKTSEQLSEDSTADVKGQV